MSGLDKLKGTDISPKNAVTAILVLVVVLSGAVAAFVRSQSVTSAVPENIKNDQHGTMSVDVQENKPSSPQATAKSVAGVAQPVPAWKAVADRNIFKAIPGYSGAKAEVAKISADPRSRPMIQPMPLGVLPFNGGGMGFRGMGRDRGGSKNVAYTGMVETPEGRFALLENTSTTQTKYAAVGDEVFGMRVVDFNAHSATLDSGGETVSLSIGENKTAAQPAAPGQTGQPTPDAAASAQPGQQGGTPAGTGRRFGRNHNGSNNGDNGGGPGGGMGTPPASQ